jgi:S-adenosylmethionine-diacylglycerol 3-amino-3-carboxypropyl transferase
LEQKRGCALFTIGSAGDNALAMLTLEPKLVLAVDYSLAQTSCIELKRAAFASLSHQQVCAFLGVREGIDRLACYRDLRGLLPQQERSFLDTRPRLIRRGIIHAGRLERFFDLVRVMTRVFSPGAPPVSELFAHRPLEDRIRFFRERLRSPAAERIISFFLGQRVMGALGRDPSQYRHVDRRSIVEIGNALRERIEHGFTVPPPWENPYLEYLVTGNFNLSLPVYLRPGCFEVIKASLPRLTVLRTGMSHALRLWNGPAFGGFCFSDVFEYMGQDAVARLLEVMLSKAAPGARLVYWNLFVPRVASLIVPRRITADAGTAGRLFGVDKVFFYSALRVEDVR